MINYSDIGKLNKSELISLLSETGDDSALYAAADAVRRRYYGDAVYIRGLIEVSNYCKNNCLYCGIRRANDKLERYRLGKDEILACCREGHELGFRTFVMQGGEDDSFTDEFVCDVVHSIKSLYPDTAVTLSLGERSYESYKAMYDAGADRYLLRHETADSGHYSRLHPRSMTLEARKKCLYDLKSIGYQVGSGFMVGSPYQSYDNIACDLEFLKELEPHMIGIGPFISHSDTPFKDEKNGTLYMTLKLIAILRLMFPKALIPSTTALGSVAEVGRELGLKAGANVIMPNLSPNNVREKYSLYDNKLHTGNEAAENLEKLKIAVKKIGYKIVTDRGDSRINKEMDCCD